MAEYRVSSGDGDQLLARDGIVGVRAAVAAIEALATVEAVLALLAGQELRKTIDGLIGRPRLS